MQDKLQHFFHSYGNFVYSQSCSTFDSCNIYKCYSSSEAPFLHVAQFASVLAPVFSHDKRKRDEEETSDKDGKKLKEVGMLVFPVEYLKNRTTILAKMCGTKCLFPELLQYSLAPPFPPNAMLDNSSASLSLQRTLHGGGGGGS